jgi:sporulation integral membrane protein YtvI
MRKKVVLGIGLAIIIYLVFRFLLPLVFPFVAAGVVSVLYYPFLRKLYRNQSVWTGKKKKWVLALSVVLLYAVILLLVSRLAMELFGEGRSLWLNFPFYQAKGMCFVKKCCSRMDALLHVKEGKSFSFVEDKMVTVWEDFFSVGIKKITSYSVQAAGRIFGFLFQVVITVLATFFMIQDYEDIREKMLQSDVGRKACGIIMKCKETLGIYVKAQGVIMILDAVVCTVAFFVIGQALFLVLGPLVALVDALPVLGAGLILLPYAAVMLFTGHLGKMAVLLAAYVCCVLIRQVTEPKMIGNKVGMRPLYTLMSMYVGFRLFGVLGFLLGPVGVLVWKELYHLLIQEKGEPFWDLSL